MLKMNKGLFYKNSAIAFAVAFAMGISSSTVFGATSAVQRIYGNDRYETAASIASTGWVDSKPTAVVIATGEDFPDALCAAPLAKKLDAPILLTKKDSLPLSTELLINQWKPSKVYIIGGTGVVSDAVAAKLSSVSSVERISGKNRFETSTKVAEKIGTSNGMVLANGYGFADALSMAPVAAEQGMPILLTAKDALDLNVSNYIKNNSSAKTYIIGGIGAISYNVASDISNWDRIAGTDRYDTNIKIIDKFKNSINLDNLYMAIGDGPNGNEFADALSGAALAAKNSGALILTNKTLPSYAENFLMSIKFKSNSKISILGGEGAVPSTVLNNVSSIVSSILYANSSSTPSNNTGSTGDSSTGSGTGSNNNTGGTSNPGDSGTAANLPLADLQAVSTQLNSVIAKVNTQNEKDVLFSIQSTINAVIANPKYDYKTAADAAHAQYSKLSPEERVDLKSCILSNIDFGLLTTLLSFFSL